MISTTGAVRSRGYGGDKSNNLYGRRRRRPITANGAGEVLGEVQHKSKVAGCLLAVALSDCRDDVRLFLVVWGVRSLWHC